MVESFVRVLSFHHTFSGNRKETLGFVGDPTSFNVDVTLLNSS